MRVPGFHPKRGFTLTELIVVIAIVMILMGLLLPVLQGFRKRARIAAAQQQMNAFNVGIDAYRDQLGALPDDAVPSSNGGELLWYYLVRKIQVGETHYGPFIEPKEAKLKTTSGANKELRSPAAPDALCPGYEYKRLKDDDGEFRRYLIVDPGPDGKLGGTIDVSTGWSGSGTDADDNIFSSSIKK
jgi:prepilin-type N-terminal cleavage/methylation domain-containing protein